MVHELVLHAFSAAGGDALHWPGSEQCVSRVCTPPPQSFVQGNQDPFTHKHDGSLHDWVSAGFSDVHLSVWQETDRR